MPAPDEPADDRPAAADVAASPQLSIERLMDQLVERASDIITSQHRVQALLTANQSIVGDLELPVVLRRIVDAAATVAGARYAALGVIGPDGTLEQFVHTGMDAETVRDIGHLPRGRGVLGAVIAHPDPIRLASIADDSRSSGFPPGHPPMTGFLGVPLRSRDLVFGNLYLTDRVDGRPFTDEDVELVEALAFTAGIAIENARLYEESERRQQWLRASSDVSRELLSSVRDDLAALELITASVQRLAAADVVTLVLPHPDDPDDLEVTVATGLGAENLVGAGFAAAGSLALHVMEQGHGTLYDSRPANRWSVHLDMVIPPGPVMAVPLTGDWSSRGAIVAGRVASRAPFNHGDLEMAEAFAEQAALALELAEARADQQRLSVLEDRDRIARDLHDHVIQRLFASELSAQILVGRTTQPEVREGLVRTIGELTATIRQIRSTILALHDPDTDSSSLRRTISLLVDQLTPLLGFRPEVHLAGPLDTLVDDLMLGDVEAVLREALTNVNRHADATAAKVEVRVDSQRLAVTVSDNGVGLRGNDEWSGLSNLRSRAAHRGGSLDLENSPQGGLRLRWSIPITL
jgi:signal transduction histidine kinase